MEDHTQDEEDDSRSGIHVHLSKVLAWIVGFATTLTAAAVIGGAATILSVDRRVEGIEEKMVTSQELREVERRIQNEYVTLREYQTRQAELLERLDRMDRRSEQILERVDRLLARMGAQGAEPDE